MNNTIQKNNSENENPFSEECQDVTCSEGEAVTELSPSSGSDFYSLRRLENINEYISIFDSKANIMNTLWEDTGDVKYIQIRDAYRSCVLDLKVFMELIPFRSEKTFQPATQSFSVKS